MLRITAVLGECGFFTSLIKYFFIAYVENADPTYINFRVRVFYTYLKFALTLS